MLKGQSTEEQKMTMAAAGKVYHDPWDAELNADPYPMFKRFRDEAPLYYNDTGCAVTSY